MQHWLYSVAILGAFLAVALIIGSSVFSHHQSSGRLYASLLTVLYPGGATSAPLDVESTAGKKAWEAAVAMTREGARWARSLHGEATIWAVVIVVMLVLALGINFFLPKRFA